MAKRKVIWSNTAVKKLYAIFEADIRKNNVKKNSIDLFGIILKQIDLVRKNQGIELKTSDESIFGLVVKTHLILYTLNEDRIIIHTIGE